MSESKNPLDTVQDGGSLSDPADWIILIRSLFERLRVESCNRFGG
jgi:hypothetical protein